MIRKAILKFIVKYSSVLRLETHVSSKHPLIRGSLENATRGLSVFLGTNKITLVGESWHVQIAFTTCNGVCIAQFTCVCPRDVFPSGQNFSSQAHEMTDYIGTIYFCPLVTRYTIHTHYSRLANFLSANLFRRLQRPSNFHMLLAELLATLLIIVYLGFTLGGGGAEGKFIETNNCQKQLSSFIQWQKIKNKIMKI